MLCVYFPTRSMISYLGARSFAHICGRDCGVDRWASWRAFACLGQLVPPPLWGFTVEMRATASSLICTRWVRVFAPRMTGRIKRAVCLVAARYFGPPARSSLREIIRAAVDPRRRRRGSSPFPVHCVAPHPVHWCMHREGS